MNIFHNMATLQKLTILLWILPSLAWPDHYFVQDVIACTISAREALILQAITPALRFYRRTVNEERFAGLHIRGLSPMNSFIGILSRCLGQRCVLFDYS